VENVAITTAIFGPESDPGSGREEDYQVLLDHLADDVVFRVTIPEGTPISGELRGKQAVADCFARLGSIAALHQEQPQQYIVDGDRVVVLGDDSFERKQNGVTARSEYATGGHNPRRFDHQHPHHPGLSALAEACRA
jgi:hypothetical protein